MKYIIVFTGIYACINNLLGSIFTFSTGVNIEFSQYNPTEGDTLSVCVVVSESLETGQSVTVMLGTDVPPGTVNPAGTQSSSRCYV